MKRELKQNEIQRLIDERRSYLDEYFNSWDDSLGEFGQYTKFLNPKVNILDEEIENKIIEHQEILDVGFIIESLTHLGQAPNLLYDDNGYFAMVCDGFQTVVTESPADIETAFVVPAENWKPTIREAIAHYLKEED